MYHTESSPVTTIPLTPTMVPQKQSPSLPATSASRRQTTSAASTSSSQQQQPEYRFGQRVSMARKLRRIRRRVLLDFVNEESNGNQRCRSSSCSSSSSRDEDIWASNRSTDSSDTCWRKYTESPPSHEVYRNIWLHILWLLEIAVVSNRQTY